MTTPKSPTAITTSRCEWAGSDPLYISYHDHEWGVPSFDDRHLFEMLILEGAQAGLSWITVLRKRERYRAVFDNFDMERVARYNTRKIATLLDDPGIIRNRLKVSAAVKNAQAAIKLRDQYGSLSAYLWQFVDGKPHQHHFRSLKDIPPSTPESEAMSKALKKAGCTFVGPTICYAFMQAVGMVNDHVVDCYRYREVGRGM